MTDTDALREKLIDAALAHVPFDGWGDKALMTAAKNLGIEPVVARNAFPGGAIEMIEFHSLLADRRMVAEFEAADRGGLKLREKVALAVRLRLQANMPHREAIRRAVATLALPIHAALAARLLYRTVDAAWHAVGDRSTDYNFYTKRMLLAGVYSSTVLFWINDKSADCAETWAFLDRRIADVMQIPKAMAKLNKLKEKLPDPLRVLRRRAAR
ncbi:MAG TPA: COQ9 family protein [Dongiaceae bacterium]